MTSIHIDMYSASPCMVAGIEIRASSEKGSRILGEWVEDELLQKQNSNLQSLSESHSLEK